MPKSKKKSATPAPALSATTDSLEFPVPEDLSPSAEKQFLNRNEDEMPSGGADTNNNPPQGLQNSTGYTGQVERQVMKFEPKQLTLNDGAFHYHVRAGTYGDIYDEIPWRVKMGLDDEKQRSIVDRTSWLGKYSAKTLIHSWNEERRDRQYIKNKRSPPISQYGHLFQTTYGSTIGKRRTCDRERAIVQHMTAFSPGAVPAHQPEFDIAMHRRCIPKPQVCLEQDVRDIWRKERETQRRIDKTSS